ncbi:TetR/AcrR family transcriptional regulator [Myxococcus sp. AB056]|uniref:TetR/AcrR family transcriptional regulator n=1 Tax=Myxococcus sp. AB056 TaxID=2562792 RepID=UPI0011463D75|nr:TetR/AcrR family transcriptional regulator [Myxococcus sp. AB056]
MPRPKLHSDEAILDAAMSVLLRSGPGAFTLNDVAVAVGMSRAALIQRFKNKEHLYFRLMERTAEQKREYFAGLPVEVGAQGLWRFLKTLVSVMGEGEALDAHLLLAWEDVRDPKLRQMAHERNLLVRDAIAVRLPPSVDRGAVSALLQGVIAGATMQWLVERTPPLTEYVLARLRTLLGCVFPRESFD